MAAETIGHVKCSECGWDSAQVKKTKKPDLPMIYCDACGSQSFTRTEKGAKGVLARMKPLKPAAAPAAPGKAAPAAKGTGLLDAFK